MNAIAKLDVTTPGDREILMRRAFKAPRGLVFRAFTEADLVKRWMWAKEWPMTECRIDLSVGGTFRFAWALDNGGAIAVTGTYKAIEPPERLVHTEVFDEDWTGGETEVTTTFTESDDRTIVRMSILYSSEEARSGALKTGMADGMEETYRQLDRLLAAGF